MPNLESFGNRPLNVVVIGASGGIGNAFVEQFLDHSSIENLYTYSRAPIVIEQSKGYWQALDFSDESSVARAAEQASKRSPIDLVILATGILHQGALVRPEKSLKDIDPQCFSDVFLANTIGPALVMKHFLPHMNKDQKSVFAVLSARVGSISDNQLGGWYSYRSSKAALNMMIKTASIEEARSNKQLCVVGLHPGTVDTDLSRPFQNNVSEEKLFTPEQSSKHLLDVIDGLSHEDTGKLFAWDGKEIQP